MITTKILPETAPSIIICPCRVNRKRRGLSVSGFNFSYRPLRAMREIASEVRSFDGARMSEKMVPSFLPEYYGLVIYALIVFS